MTQRTEDKYFDQLMQIEFAVLGFYDDHPDLTDAMVDSVYEELGKRYRAEATAHDYKAGKLDGLRETLHEEVLPICEMILGRPNNILQMEPITAEELRAMLSRLRSSLKSQGKRGGRQAYLKFIATSGEGQEVSLDDE